MKAVRGLVGSGNPVLRQAHKVGGPVVSHGAETLQGNTRSGDLICAGGAGLPSSGKLGSLYITIVLVLFTLGGDPRNPSFPPGALRRLSEGSCQRGCLRKLEVMIHDIYYMRLRACFDNLFDKNSRKAFKKLRRIKKDSKKKIYQRLKALKGFKKNLIYYKNSDLLDQIS